MLQQDRLTLAGELGKGEYFRYDGREYLRCGGIEYEDIVLKDMPL